MSRWKQETASERFWKFVEKLPGCWIWTGHKNSKGYGSFFLEGREANRRYVKAHRFSYIERFGHLAEGFQIHHKCENPSCVNPEHLEPLTVLAHAKKRKWPVKTHCLRGHLYDQANTYRRKNTGRTSCRMCSKIRQKEAYWRRKA